MIEFRDVSKTYDNGRSFSVKDLNLTVDKGEFLVLLGSSGGGKTTTLKMINRLTETSQGSLLVNGKDVSAYELVQLRRSIGYVFQGIGLFPHMTVGENVEIVPKLLGWSKGKREERARELCDLVELPYKTFADRMPDQLSGGQQQRIGVARALASNPDILLMDEPFGALDAVTRDKLQQQLLSIKGKLGKTFVFVTHDLFEALTLGDRIAIFHEGSMQQVGTPREIMAAPATAFISSLFEKPAKQLRDFKGMM